MKKTLIMTFGCFLLGTTLISCSNAEQTATNAEAYVSLQGVVERVTEVNENMPQARYLLKSDRLIEGTIYLESASLNLDRFLEKHVTLQGLWKEDGVLFIVEAAEILPEDKNTNTNELRSFSSSSQGVYFSYPAAWQVEESGQGAIEVLSSESKRLVRIFRVPSTNAEAFDAWVTRNYGDDQIQEYQIGLLTGKRVLQEEEEILLVSDNSAYYTLIFTRNQASEVEKGYSTLQSSLRFFTPGDVPALTETTTTNTTVPVSDAQNIITTILEQKGTLLGAESTVSQVEVAGEQYVYVTYVEGEKQKKALFSYTNNEENYSFEERARFEAGESTTWVKVSGENVAANLARQVFAVRDGAATTSTSIASGKSLYENTQLGFQLQYPRSWYYSARSISTEGGLQRVTFSDAPLDDEPTQQIQISVYPKNGISVDDATRASIGGKDGYILSSTDGEQFALEGADGRVYVSNPVQGAEEKQRILELLGSLQTK